MNINKSMDLDDRIKQAARQAVIESSSQGTTYDGQHRPLDSEWVSVYYKGTEKPFSVRILLGGHPQFPSDTSLDVLTKQIAQELIKNKQNN